MKRCVLKIFVSDVKKVCTNWVSIVVLAGLILLPSLYAWVNILASWDPYGNTKNVKVVIVNEDQGGKIKDMQINIGEELTKMLKENKKLGWTFCESREEGIRQVDQGRVYATIVIPETFSREMATVIDPNPIKPKLEYYVNEKINAIAPKMTDSGASTIQREISTSFIEAVTEKVFEILKTAGVELEKEYPKLEKYKNMLIMVNDDIPEVNTKLAKLEEGANNGVVKVSESKEDIEFVKKTLQQIIDLVDDVNKDLLGTNEKLQAEAPQIRENLILAQSIFANISKLTGEISKDIVDNKPIYVSELERMNQNIRDLEDKLDDVATASDNLNGDLSSSIKSKVKEINADLDQYIIVLEEVRRDVHDLDKVVKLLDQLGTLNKKIGDDIGELKRLTDKGFTNLENDLQLLSTICKDLAALIGQIDNGVKNFDVVTAQIDALTAQIDKIQSHMAANPSIYGQLPNQLETLKTTLNNLKQKIADQGKTSAGGIIDFSKIVEQLQNQLLMISSSIDSVRNTIMIQHTNVSNLLSQAENSFRELSTYLKETSTKVNYYKRKMVDQVDEIINELYQTQDKLDKTSKELMSTMDKANGDVESVTRILTHDLENARRLMKKVKSTLTNQDGVEETLMQVSLLTNNMENATRRICESLDAQLLPKMQAFTSKSSILLGDTSQILTNLKDNLDSAQKFLGRLETDGEVTVKDIKKLRETVPKMQKDVGKLTDKIKAIDGEVNVKELIDLVTGNNDKRVDFFTYPVELETHKLFPMANYGAAMTPFYSTLSLWVGALLLSALLTTKAKNAQFKYNSVQEFFGKYLLFGSAAFLQGLIVALGDVYLLKVEMQEPLLFLVLTPFYSMVFTMIVYSLVSLFGNVGKAIGVIFLVLQLAASGGTFPIQVTPTFFQKINTALPFTYAISGMREAIAGVVYHTLVKDIAILLIFFVAFMVLGVLLKKLANKFLAGFQHKLGESGIIEH